MGFSDTGNKIKAWVAAKSGTAIMALTLAIGSMLLFNLLALIWRIVRTCRDRSGGWRQVENAYQESKIGTPRNPIRPYNASQPYDAPTTRSAASLPRSLTMRPTTIAHRPSLFHQKRASVASSGRTAVETKDGDGEGKQKEMDKDLEAFTEQDSLVRESAPAGRAESEPLIYPGARPDSADLHDSTPILPPVRPSSPTRSTISQWWHLALDKMPDRQQLGEVKHSVADWTQSTWQASISAGGNKQTKGKGGAGAGAGQSSRMRDMSFGRDGAAAV
ncbi:hypothetical protein MNV49_004664 [Pseudohyphozyma bogoriensis]|nr:hypothetical protein MNV49_004664 [Pseudohyphozyma bogoriensis]